MLTQWSLWSCLVLTSVIKVLAVCLLAVRLVSLESGNTSRGNRIQGTGTIRQKRRTHTKAVTGIVIRGYVIYTNYSTLRSPCPVCWALYVWDLSVNSRTCELVWRGSTSNRTKACLAAFFLFKRQIHVRTTNHLIRFSLDWGTERMR